jgi:hypothetical protein
MRQAVVLVDTDVNTGSAGAAAVEHRSGRGRDRAPIRRVLSGRPAVEHGARSADRY